jgi:hypothetical protein
MNSWKKLHPTYQVNDIMKNNNSIYRHVARRNFLKTGALIASAVPAQSAFSIINGIQPRNSILVLSTEWAYLADLNLIPNQNKEQLIILDMDLFRLWRNDLQQQVFAQNKTIYGMTNWTDFLLLKGMVQESNLLLNPAYKKTSNFNQSFKLQLKSDNLIIPDSTYAATKNKSLLINWTLCLQKERLC